MVKITGIFKKYGIFLIIPGIVLGFSILLKLAAGPFWLATNFDGSYVYLANGLEIVKGNVPDDITHPATPMEILTSVICRGFNIGRSADDAVIQVLKSPEFYLHMVCFALALFSFLTSIFLGIYVFRKTKDPLAALLTQLPALSFLVLKSYISPDPVLPVVANVGSEALQIGIINLFSICLIKYFFAATSLDEWVTSLSWGFVCGWGVAEKLTFIPILLVPLVILSWKNKIIFVAVFVASFVAWTWPVHSKYPVLWAMIKTMLTQQGIYGQGRSGFIDIHSYFLNWATIITGHWVFVGFELVVLLFLLWILVSKKWEKVSSFLLVTALGVLFDFSVVAKHPGPQYLVPGLGLFSALLFLFYWQGFCGHALGRRVVCILVLVFIVAGVWRATQYQSNMAKFTKDILSFQKYVHTKYQDYVFVNYYRSSGQEWALYLGDAWQGSPQLSKEMGQLYPNKYFLSRWSFLITDFKGRVLSDDLLGQGAGVIFQGDGEIDPIDFSKSPFKVRLLEKGRFESLYLLTGTTEKQSMMFYLGALHFIQSQDVERALQCARQAKALHYFPQSSVDNLIRLLSAHQQ